MVRKGTNNSLNRQMFCNIFVLSSRRGHRSLVSFIAGYGVHANVSQSDIQPLAQAVKVQHDAIMQTETIRDTIYQTRTVTKTVTKYVEPLTAQTEPQSTVSEIRSTASSAEQMACSMLCDNIP